VSLVAATLRESVADRPVDVSVYSQDLAAQYSDDRAFRDSILISGLVALAIALTGLWGYTSDQIRRRIREITIRKINGAEKGDILRMISKDVSYVALPALVTGVAAAYTVASGWLERFVVRVALSPAMFAAVAVSVYVIIIGCVLWRAYRAAAEPPARGLKTE
ncbi:MAG: ABC transporter permease, partial [Rikenellaceae bacterium]|nr:ABC transporter permease [Rikenellaceae bacterium]